ncbi:heterogeneous nuclear ribonucleoprotein Q [Typha angustifolia]|uniref:heterogeneous nuclear ribonucleoprotein Q n=1 Tax=Typha angustifolia TaxID=59011 RepID=UPI003C2D10FB
MAEPEEQIDLEGDNDIEEDIMDDEDGGEDEGYRKVGEGFEEEEEDEPAEEWGSEGEGQEKVSGASDGADEAPGSIQEGEEVENAVGPKDEEGRRKWAELLALPPHGSEVFIGGLPRDAKEEDLRELCQPFGEIFEVRLMKDKDTGESKGFAFITFTTRDAAQNAIEEIHDKEFKGRTLRCSLSQAKHRLFVGNVPKSLTEEELRKMLEESGPGVENVEFFKDQHDPSRNRGFLFVEYHNNACADYARQKMSNSDFKIEGSNLTVSWADPKSSSDSSAAAQVKAIYVKNLPENITKEKIKEIFERHGEITKVVLPPAKAGQKRDFGFIHFAERSSALKAVKGTEKYEIDGHVVEASLAKPQADKKPDYSQKPGLLPSFPPYPPYGYPADPYGAYGGGGGGGGGSGGYGSSGYNQPVIYGRGPMPSGMRMVPMVLPDGRLGYVLQQPGAQAPPPPPRRSDRRGGSSDSGGGRNSEGSRGRRYHPY